ncbi:Splicing factor sf1 [Mycena indigotica]|uniref:Branchpoint-bridging protein n=1 Tax=Mycena indigotica TaxID=2126181 RepID=A0A8H6SC43_9AGAR|nr:Splicing factor sf1 [Mycena indigotica]KAF7296810.1 Splicing factor sf1 [Mycena indigotica]
MERESGAKISIRGKGSVKDGKTRPADRADDAEEDLHCLVTADTQDKVAACVKLINKVIETAASTPESENELKRKQLRELAAICGTLRDDEKQIVCRKCGGEGHRQYDCPEFTRMAGIGVGVVCRACGGAGHVVRDCAQRKGLSDMAGFDAAYADLMVELGQGAVPAQAGGAKIPPWRRPENWLTSTNNSQASGYRAQTHYGIIPGVYNPGYMYGSSGYWQQ